MIRGTSRGRGGDSAG